MVFIEFRLLGPVEAWANGEAIPLGPAKQRALVAFLLLHANEVVSTDRLIEAIWGESPPPTAAHSLQVYVSRLRKLLDRNGDRGGVLLTRPHGYVLQVGSDRLDLGRFESLVEKGRAALAETNPAQAAAFLEEALGLWRGEPLADFRFEPFAQHEIERLKKLQLGALADRIEADIALDRCPAVLPELEALVAEHPLDERLARQLMLALYRSGRQAEALGVYRETRHLLVDQLAIEPGHELRQLEQAILRQDPSLTASTDSGKPVLPARPLSGLTPGRLAESVSGGRRPTALSSVLVGFLAGVALRGRLGGRASPKAGRQRA